MLIQGHDLLEFARESVVVYLDDEDRSTRKDAALCCCKLIATSFSGIASAHFGSNRLSRSGGKRHRLIEEVWCLPIFIFDKFSNLFVLEILIL